MNNKQLSFLFLISALFFFGCNSNQKTTNNVVDSVLYHNYSVALNNRGTVQYFVVVKVKNINTGEIREVCTKGNFLEGAVHRESNLAYTNEGLINGSQILLGNTKRYFEFKSQDALNNIGYGDYSIENLNQLESEIDFDSLATSIIQTQSWKMQLDDKTMVMYAHELFNRGILTGENSCFGGTLFYIDPSKKE